MTVKGLRLLDRANLDVELEVGQRVYDRLERTDRIDRIEAMEERPTPDWYEAGTPVTESGTRSATADDSG